MDEWISGYPVKYLKKKKEQYNNQGTENSRRLPEESEEEDDEDIVSKEGIMWARGEGRERTIYVKRLIN